MQLYLSSSGSLGNFPEGQECHILDYDPSHAKVTLVFWNSNNPQGLKVRETTLVDTPTAPGELTVSPAPDQPSIFGTEGLELITAVANAPKGLSGNGSMLLCATKTKLGAEVKLVEAKDLKDMWGRISLEGMHTINHIVAYRSHDDVFFWITTTHGLKLVSTTVKNFTAKVAKDSYTADEFPGKTSRYPVGHLGRFESTFSECFLFANRKGNFGGIEIVKSLGNTHASWLAGAPNGIMPQSVRPMGNKSSDHRYLMSYRDAEGNISLGTLEPVPA